MGCACVYFITKSECGIYNFEAYNFISESNYIEININFHLKILLLFLINVMEREDEKEVGPQSNILLIRPQWLTRSDGVSKSLNLIQKKNKNLRFIYFMRKNCTKVLTLKNYFWALILVPAKHVMFVWLYFLPFFML